MKDTSALIKPEENSAKKIHKTRKLIFKKYWLGWVGGYGEAKKEIRIS